MLKQTLIRHVVEIACDVLACSGDVPSFCELVCLQIRPSFPDTDQTAFVLSLACLNPAMHASTLKCVLDIMTGHSHLNGSTSPMWDKLKSYIYSIHKGKSVYQSVLHGLLKSNSKLS